MADPTRERDDELRDPLDDDDEHRFSQDDDDRAGRSWHGMNSETHEVGMFEEDEDDDETDRPGRTERI